jgi:hypothetical protein
MASASTAAKGVVSATVNASSLTGPYFVIVISGATGSGTVTISEPLLVEGITPAYVENDLGFGSSTNSGAAFSSVALNGGTPWTSSSSANSQVVTCPTGGTSTQYCGADGNWHTASGSGTVTTFSAPGAASTPSVLFSGTPYTAGTGTTAYPLVSIWSSGATGPSTWSTSGTMLGINAPSGFTGNLIDAHLNGGGSLFSIADNGIAAAAAFTSTGNITAGSGASGFKQSGLANSGMYSSASGLIELGSTDTQAGSVARVTLDMAGGGVAATLAAGAAITGTGTGYVAPACATSHVCSSMDGTVTFTTGSTAASTGVLLTITDATTHTNLPDCQASIVQSSSPYTAIGNYLFSYSTTVWTLNVGTAPSGSTAYTVTYHCMGY